MSKKTNTLWFILGATVFNVLSTVISFLVLFVLYFRFLSPMLPESAAPIGIIFVFIGAIALSFVLYRFILKRITAKIDLDKHFDPLFGRRRPGR
ncbi:MAG: leader peptide processing enzyme [Treponema sp.]|jgi:membrane protein implicated in regulation of membrane protease activity|nr:leader peptide processing enzyme [Treponema sp.]